MIKSHQQKTNLQLHLKTKKKRRKIPVITEADIHAGCAVQMRGALQMTQFDHRCVPTAGLPSLVLDDTTRQKVLDVVVSTPFVVVSSSLSSSMSVCHFISKTDDAPPLS